MDTLALCRKFVLDIRSTYLTANHEGAKRIAGDLATSPPEIAYASVVAAARSTPSWNDDLHSDANSPESRWIQRHFVEIALQALHAGR